MPYNGTGTFNRLYSWVADANAGKVISPTEFDADGNDVAAALSLAITKDGQQTIAADIPWNGKRILNLGACQQAGDGVAWGSSPTLGTLTLATALAVASGGTGATNLTALLAAAGITAGIGTTGYLKIGNGTGTPIYLQWGGGQVPSSAALAVTYPVAFPNNLGAVICGTRGSGGSTMLQTATTAETRTSFQANMNYTSGGGTGAAGNNAFFWGAVGY